MPELSKYARTSESAPTLQPSKYARKAGQSSTREFTGVEAAVRSMRRAVEKAEEYRAEICRLREQVEKQHAWLYSPDVPEDDLWWQRREIYDDRWQSLEQDIGNLTGWVGIHLAEAGRYGAEERKAAGSYVAQLYEIEEWMRREELHSCKQYPNGDDPCPF